LIFKGKKRLAICQLFHCFILLIENNKFKKQAQNKKDQNNY